MINYRKIKNKIGQYESFYIVLKNIRSYLLYYFNKASYSLFEKISFFRELKYWPNIHSPRSFNEKIFWKKIYDRNPLLPKISDKYRVRDYIINILGENKAKELLIPLLFVTEQPEEIPFKKLPSSFIIKPNHASGTNIVIENEQYDTERIVKTCKKWLKIPYGLEKLEWAYQSIPRKIIIEQLLREENGGKPTEYRFFMFNGECHLIYVIIDRINNPSRSFFDGEWNFLTVKKANRPQGPILEKLHKYYEMLELAKKISSTLDFVRVDFYQVRGKIFIGELTSYPSSGKLKFDPSSFDFELGYHWGIKPKYWTESER